jgi:hypothetical protein
MPGRFIDPTPYADYETIIRYARKSQPQEQAKQPSEEVELKREESKSQDDSKQT